MTKRNRQAMEYAAEMLGETQHTHFGVGLSPSEAGFDGGFSLRGQGSYRIVLAHAAADSPKRWNVARRMLCCWRNSDKSVAQLLYRNDAGQLFSLEFVPMEESHGLA